MIDRARLVQLRAIEDERFLKTHPKSGELFEKAKLSMPGECQCHGCLSGQVLIQYL